MSTRTYHIMSRKISTVLVLEKRRIIVDETRFAVADGCFSSLHLLTSWSHSPHFKYEIHLKRVVRHKKLRQKTTWTVQETFREKAKFITLFCFTQTFTYLSFLHLSWSSSPFHSSLVNYQSVRHRRWRFEIEMYRFGKMKRMRF